ncbi:hypothetical protein [Neisseria animaloris]|uniref:hypothetical protein n=1 Tax=Neisseria animaloris TaxID=326522 RepID=UPI000D332F36|nr:hypothetical protein [Neisseria animaloris]
MQNIQTAQQAQNPQTVTVSIDTARKAADALYDFEQLADAAETIAITIQELIGGGNMLIHSQAELLARMVEKTRLDCNGKSLCYDLYDVVDTAEEAAKKKTEQTAR